ncbi:MAG: hypothetical protein JW776_03375 [Candidatus Lokiarchaeota archaeon]|nr:hypothetical protein [Candidatus Lokiarchaeota archaeon]
MNVQMEIPKDTILLAKTHPPMYLIHRYWARKPYNVVKAYIQKYTEPGDVVLDPFCGSGVTIAESVLLGRNAIGIDVNPFSVFLTQTTIISVEISKLVQYFTSIYEAVNAQITDLYGVKCPYCNNQAVITQIIWKNMQNDNQLPPNEQIEEIRINCSHCDKSNDSLDRIRHVTLYKEETHRVEQIKTNFKKILSKENITLPTIKFQYRNGVKFKQIRHFLIQEPDAENLFTKRNLLVLGKIRKAINSNIPPQTKDPVLLDIRNLILLTFTANLGQSSKMVWVISKRKGKYRDKKEVGSWTHHFYWNPKMFFEINPLIGFRNRMEKTIRAQRNLQKRLHLNKVKKILRFGDWAPFHKSSANTKILLIKSSAERINLPDECVDYIFTDPPYGDSIQYFELSTLWNKWLNFQTNNSEKFEIVINPRQGKEKTHYFNGLENAFNECYRVLKKEHFMTLTFHNTDISVRNGLIQSVRNAGFHLDSLLFQMPPRNSLKSYLHYEKSPVGDYFLRFRKTSTPLLPQKMGLNDLSENIKSIIIEVLRIRGEPTPILIIYNCIDEELAKLGQFPLDDVTIVEKIISKMRNSNEITINKNRYIWFTNPTDYASKVPLTQRISSYLKSIENFRLNPSGKLYNLVYSQFNGFETPDRKDLTVLIENIKKNTKNSGEKTD